MKKVFICCISLLSCLSLFSQTEKVSQEKRNALKAESMAVKSEVIVTKYANLEHEITANLIKRQIPAGFPEFDSRTETVEQYKSRINNWYLQNKELLNSEFKNKLIENSKQN